MQKHYIKFLFLLLPFSMFGYNQDDVSTFTEEYAYIAVQQMVDFEIPASIILAQAFLESKHGTSELARDYNNFFGIKSRANWTGQSVMMSSAEYKNRKKFVKKSKFRFYQTPEESWYDHSAFLSSGKRYRRLFEQGAFNYKGWARGLQKAGYATDPKYAKKLIHLIEKHHFNDFDKVAFRIKQGMSIEVGQFHAENHSALATIQSIYAQQAHNVSEMELLRAEAEKAYEIKKVAESIVLEPTEELDDNKFYIFLSEDDAPIIKEVQTAELYRMKVRKKR